MAWPSAEPTSAGRHSFSREWDQSATQAVPAPEGKELWPSSHGREGDLHLSEGGGGGHTLTLPFWPPRLSMGRAVTGVLRARGVTLAQWLLNRNDE